MKTWFTGSGCRMTRILFGRTNVFLLSNGTSNILVDTGWSGEGSRLLRRLGKAGKPDAVIMTHTHFDHAGNAGKVKEKFSPVFIVHEGEKGFLESGYSPIPRGTMACTRFIYNLGAQKVPKLFHVKGVKADFTYSERHDLSAFKFNAFILHTPGHSAGSSSVVIENEIVLVGDSLVGMPLSIFPPWGDNVKAMIESWKKLLDTGCHTFHPSHGMPVSRERLEKEYRKISTRHL